MMETEFKRNVGFGNLPHYYDENFTEDRSSDGLFVKELCPVCKSHLLRSGICQNACHLSDSARKRLSEILMECMKPGM